MNKFKPEIELLRCHFNLDESHFYNEPKILPCCSNLACLECISNEFANGHLKCTFCNKKNLIGDLKDLKSNENVIDQINLRSNDITIEIEEKLKKFANESKAISIQQVEEMCKNVKEHIDKRIETVDKHLESLQTDLLESVKLIKEKAHLEFSKLNKETENKVDEHDKFSKTLKSIITDFEINKEEAMKKIYECQNHLNDLIFCEEKFRLLFRKIRFESSNWIPDESFLCPCFEVFEK